jgi:hypothetical protein
MVIYSRYKIKNMELTLEELNEIYYCLNKISQVKDNAFIDYKLVEQIIDKIRNEIKIK